MAQGIGQTLDINPGLSEPWVRPGKHLWGSVIESRPGGRENGPEVRMGWRVLTVAPRDLRVASRSWPSVPLISAALGRESGSAAASRVGSSVSRPLVHPLLEAPPQFFSASHTPSALCRSGAPGPGLAVRRLLASPVESSPAGAPYSRHSGAPYLCRRVGAIGPSSFRWNPRSYLPLTTPLLAGSQLLAHARGSARRTDRCAGVGRIGLCPRPPSASAWWNHFDQRALGRHLPGRPRSTCELYFASLRMCPAHARMFFPC